MPLPWARTAQHHRPSYIELQIIIIQVYCLNAQNEQGDCTYTVQIHIIIITLSKLCVALHCRCIQMYRFCIRFYYVCTSLPIYTQLAVLCLCRTHTLNLVSWLVNLRLYSFIQWPLAVCGGASYFVPCCFSYIYIYIVYAVESRLRIKRSVTS